ncbi:MAG TPA: hypothetical protein VFT66_09225 [Roseiflexaceae bacterium]|nr:hypothetical protein [Roseiflexaceae bacterium]
MVSYHGARLRRIMDANHILSLAPTITHRDELLAVQGYATTAEQVTTRRSGSSLEIGSQTDH